MIVGRSSCSALDAAVQGVEGPSGGIEVQLQGLVKTFGRVKAVDDVSLTAGGGSFVTLLGPSGSGKTTTLMMIAGFVEPDRGEVLIGGTSVTTVPPHRRSIGVVFQHYALFPHKTVLENIAYPLRMRRTPQVELRKRVQAALNLIQLPDIGDRYPRELSGGQQQRVALARALVFEPQVMLMDEPLGALDRKLREQMQVELRNIQQKLGVTTISVTHDQEEAMALSDAIVVMRDGRIEQIGPPNDLYERPATPFIADFLGVSNLIAGEVATTAAGARQFRGDGGLEVPLAPTAAAGLRHLMIRPERIRWADSEPADVVLNGRIDAVTYLGERVRYRIALPGGQYLIATRQNRAEEAVLPVDATARIGWKIQDVVLI